MSAQPIQSARHRSRKKKLYLDKLSTAAHLPIFEGFIGRNNCHHLPNLNHIPVRCSIEKPENLVTPTLRPDGHFRKDVVKETFREAFKLREEDSLTFTNHGYENRLKSALRKTAERRRATINLYDDTVHEFQDLFEMNPPDKRPFTTVQKRSSMAGTQTAQSGERSPLSRSIGFDNELANELSRPTSVHSRIGTVSTESKSRRFQTPDFSKTVRKASRMDKFAFFLESFEPTQEALRSSPRDVAFMDAFGDLRITPPSHNFTMSPHEMSPRSTASPHEGRVQTASGPRVKKSKDGFADIASAVLSLPSPIPEQSDGVSPVYPEHLGFPVESESDRPYFIPDFGVEVLEMMKKEHAERDQSDRPPTSHSKRRSSKPGVLPSAGGGKNPASAVAAFMQSL